MNDLKERIDRLSPDQLKLLRTRIQMDNRARAKGGSISLPSTTTGPKQNGHSKLARKMDFSLFFFSGDGATESVGKYDFLMECARFADQNGLCAIWTPERHFQTFGGLFPNPSVLSAALAAVTKRIQIRAGSVVLPLHHPIRVAEEWSLVDNLSKGRVAISLATGWSRGDFTLAPDKFDQRRTIAFDSLSIIQRLWAGEPVCFDGVNGEPVSVTIFPRPIQRRLPIWVTVSGNPQTWVKAGELGANVLTSMSGGPTDLAPQIASYREARKAHGHDPHAGIVSVMMHTLLGEDERAVKDQVREPLCDYLGTFIAQGGILRSQETGGEPDAINERDRREMLLFAFERYFQQSGLLGSFEKCTRVVDAMQEAGVDEIACLIDFGADRAEIRRSLDHLSRLCGRYSGAQTE